jgi:hypothetical protein
MRKNLQIPHQDSFLFSIYMPWLMDAFFDDQNKFNRNIPLVTIHQVYEFIEEVDREASARVLNMFKEKFLKWRNCTEMNQFYSVLQLMGPLGFGHRALLSLFPEIWHHVLSLLITQDMQDGVCRVNTIVSLKTIVFIIPRVMQDNFAFSEVKNLVGVQEKCKDILTATDNEMDEKRLAGMVLALILRLKCSSYPQNLISEGSEMMESLQYKPRTIFIRAFISCAGYILRAVDLDTLLLRLLDAMDKESQDVITRILAFEGFVTYCEVRFPQNKGRDFQASKDVHPLPDSSILERLSHIAFAHLEDTATVVQFKAKIICETLMKFTFIADQYIDLALKCHSLNKVKVT